MGAALQIEGRVAFEAFREHLCIVHAGETPETGFFVPVVSGNEKCTIAIDQAVWLEALAAGPSGRAGAVAEFHHPTGKDCLSQKFDQVGIDRLLRARSHGKSPDSHQRFEIGVSPFQRVALDGAHLGVDFFQPRRLFLKAGSFQSL